MAPIFWGCLGHGKKMATFAPPPMVCRLKSLVVKIKVPTDKRIAANIATRAMVIKMRVNSDVNNSGKHKLRIIAVTQNETFGNNQESRVKRGERGTAGLKKQEKTRVVFDWL